MEGPHDLADALKSDLGIRGLAVPDPPVQAVDLRDDQRLGSLPLRRVNRQVAGRLLGMLQPHRDVEPVEERRFRDAGLDQEGAQALTAIGEGGQLSVGGMADVGEAALDQRLDCGVGPGGPRQRPAGRRLDVAKANFEMLRAVLAAPDEG